MGKLGKEWECLGKNGKTPFADVVPLHCIPVGAGKEPGQFADTRTVAQKRSMAKLIWELKTRFPKARILGHRDLPGVRKVCPCYDVAKDQTGEEPSQSLKSLPQIQGTFMHRGQKHASDSGHIYARGAET